MGASLRRNRRDDDAKPPKIDPGDGKAWADLGLKLIRAGDETEGVAALRACVAEGPLQRPRLQHAEPLREGRSRTSYETVEGTPFRIRYHKDERAILDRATSPRMLNEAWTLDGEALRLHAHRARVHRALRRPNENFSVRTSGLPNIGIQGVCFGKTLAAMSPRAEPFNWGNVLWHELGHVFAIQLSKSHVPRWFTEGLANTRPSFAGPSGSAKKILRSSARSRRAHSLDRAIQPGLHPRRRRARRDDRLLRRESGAAVPRRKVRHGQDHRDAPRVGRGQADTRGYPKDLGDKLGPARRQRTHLAARAAHSLCGAIRPRSSHAGARNRDAARDGQPARSGRNRLRWRRRSPSTINSKEPSRP